MGGLTKGAFGGQEDAQVLAENGNVDKAQRVDSKIEKQTNDLESYGESLSGIPRNKKSRQTHHYGFQ